MALLYSDMAKKAGINLRVEKSPLDGYWNNVWMNKPMSMVFWYGRPTADAMFSTVYSSGSSWNDTYWKNEKFDQLLSAARVEMDEAKRKQMYFDLQSMVSDEGGAVIPVYSNLICAVSDKIAVKNRVSGESPLDGQRNASRWAPA